MRIVSPDSPQSSHIEDLECLLQSGDRVTPRPGIIFVRNISLEVKLRDRLFTEILLISYAVLYFDNTCLMYQLLSMALS